MIRNLPTVALSVRQPWAWLIVHGYKDIEARTWRTNFRGRVLIHAGKIFGKDEDFERRQVIAESGILIPEHLPTGGIVGMVEIVDCVPPYDSRLFRSNGRCFGWVLRRAQPLPFQPMAGKPGFFNVRGKKSFSLMKEL